ncbi:peroxisomal leader peptide-processing protease-like isoform X2 [Adelges cooleyi]|uniref:peroxisomal leader peptide-processing protease-like isoform X2 n=1 Tax=Adelges cooleyi TaxID=133065 RepID=UPI00217F665C|nr:peroxisomal leader peptide-processing protease-like isoform X2 [Adelges cooleyi]
MDLIYKSVVKVECGSNEGSAVCVHTSNSVGHVFLTCSHVVRYKTGPVILRHNDNVIKGKVIFAVRKGVPFDIAIILSEKTINIVACQISDENPVINQEVFAVGYPSIEKKLKISFGHIHATPLSSILTTNCQVYLGFSGGPVFGKDNKLLGLTIGMLNVDIIVLENLESKCPKTKMIWNNGVPNLNLCHF